MLPGERGLQMNGAHALPAEPHIFLIHHTGLTAGLLHRCLQDIALQAQHHENSRVALQACFLSPARDKLLEGRNAPLFLWSRPAMLITA